MTATENTYLVAGHKPWNREHFNRILVPRPGRWVFIDRKDQLTAEAVQALAPRYVFFLHWSHLVPEDLVRQFECVCFHMTDVPYGRGGSPLQNLIARGHQTTKLSALRMTEKLDDGPVYAKQDLILSGTAEEIYVRASLLACQMIIDLIVANPVPAPQVGDPVFFSRRKPEDSRLPPDASLEALHDFIRMLDADAYPHAFLESGAYRMTFNRSSLYHGKIKADVTIERRITEKHP